jgi:uncharacterized protein
MTHFDLRRLKLRAGEEYRDEVELELEPIELAGQRYLPVPERAPAELVVTRASTGLVLGLRFRTRLHGPCMRCLDDAVLDLSISAREYHANAPGDSEELRTEYVVDDRLDLSQWARDALVLALPDKILCRPECAGLCPVCGKNLNTEPHAHEEEPVDSRWSALAELKDRL